MNRYNENGFTVIEILAALILIAAILAVALPSLLEATRAMEVRIAISNIESLLGTARKEAIRTNASIVAVFDCASQRLFIEPLTMGRFVYLKRDRFFLLSSGSDEEIRIEFFGDATSSGGEALFSDSGGELYDMRVEQRNGRYRFEKRRMP